MGRAEGDREIEPIMERPSLVLSVSLPPRPATPPKSFFQYKVASPGPQSLSTVQSNHRREVMQSSLLARFLGPFGKEPCSLGSSPVELRLVWVGRARRWREPLSHR